MKWLIEKGTFSEDLNSLLTELNKQEIHYEMVKYVPFQDDQYVFDKESEAIFYGSLNMAKFIQNHTKLRPGAICNFHNLKYSTYYPRYREFLFNKDFSILPLSQALKYKDKIFKDFGVANWVFARPDSGNKEFPGDLFSLDDFTLEGFGYGYSHEDQTLPILISSAKNIKNEYRFFVSETNEILAGSSYFVDDHRIHTRQIAPSVLEYVLSVLHTVKWKPDPLFVMDICTDDKDNLYVTELNSFSCSGSYACKMDKIVKKVSELYAI
jgi:hypothetical protein